MHNENERPLDENSQNYHFSTTYNGCEFCLLTPFASVSSCFFFFFSGGGGEGGA